MWFFGFVRASHGDESIAVFVDVGVKDLDQGDPGQYFTVLGGKSKNSSGKGAKLKSLF